MADSYDSLNASYGMNGQALFARVNVDEMKVGDALGHFFHVSSCTVVLILARTWPFCFF